MSRSNSVSSQHQMNQNSNHPVNTSIGNAGAMSIHLGNYIINIPKDYAPQSLEEQSSPVKRQGHMKNRSGQWARDRSRSPAVPIPTTEISANGQSAIKFELSWIKFVKDAEDDYNRRLSRNDKPQQLSIFEVNQDLFELYLLNVSGRALAKIQYLNLDLKSSMCSEMKIFDNQSGLMPPESVMMADQLAEIERRRHQRMVRRERLRRETAHFNTQSHQIEAALIEEEQKFNITENEQAELTHHFSIIDAQPPQATTIVEEAQQLIIKLAPMEEEQLAVSPSVTQEFQQVEEEEIKEPIQQQLQQQDEVPFQQQILETGTPPKPKKKKVLLDSLNDRSDDEDEEEGDRSSPGSPIPETEDEFDRDDMAQTAHNVNPTQIFNTNGLQMSSMEATATLQHVETPEVPSPELMTPENNNTLNNDQEILENVYPNQQLESSLDVPQQQLVHKLEISIDDQSQILSKEQVKDVSVQKIKIGDMTIEDPYMSLNEEGVLMQYDPNGLEGTQNNDEMMISGQGGEHYTLNEVTDPMLDNSNPFREKSVKSYINSPYIQKAAPSIVESESNNLPKSQDILDQQDFGSNKPQLSKEGSISALKEDQDQSVHADQRNENHIQIQERSHGSTNTTRQFQQMSSQQSIQVDEKTNSIQDLHHHISYEQGQDPMHITQQDMSAITSGRKASKNISGLNSVRVNDIEQPEREVVLRFEVAVGTTPLNLTFDEVSALYEPQLQKADAALGGNTPLDQTVEQMRENLTVIDHPAKNDAATGITQREINVKQDASIIMSQKSINDVALSAFNLSSHSKAQSKSQKPGGGESPQPKSLNTSQDQQARSLSPSRLEVTLTAEPDKPIMVEVRGGEKQFLISALTKHIYDILSQPNRLHIFQDENGAVQFGDSEDPNAPGQHLEPVIDSTGKGAFKLGNQNINLRLKSVKKNQDLELPVLQNLGGKNVREIKQELNQTLPKVLDDTQQAKICMIEDMSKQDEGIFNHNTKIESKSQQLEEQPMPANQSTLQGPLSVENQPDNRYSLPEVTASARDNSCFIIIQPSCQINGRPSILSENVMPLTPHSAFQDRIPSPPPPVQQESPSNTKKRVTMLANTEGKINEELNLGSSFEEEIPSEPLSHGTVQQLPSHNRNSAEGSFRKVNSGNQMIIKQIQDQIRSRPETANFNKAHAAIAADNINPFIQQEEEDSNEIKQPQLETPKNQIEEELDVSNADQKSRLETPHADLLDGTPYSNFQNSVPAQLEEYIQQPLHPTIPEQHPNGYFSNDSDYMMVMPPDGNSLANGVSSHSNDQYLTPKLAYYDQFPQSMGQVPSINLPTSQQIQQQLLRHQSINDFYSSQYGYSDADQNIEDFILAEGYPLLNFVKEGGRNSLSSLQTDLQSIQDKNHRLRVDRSSKPQQIIDFNGQSYSHQNTTNATLETPPNAYRIRKVILPNQANVTSLSQQSDMDDLRKQTPSSQPLRPQLNNTLQPNIQNAGAVLRKQKTMQSSLKQLPVVKTKKRIFNNTINNITIYSVNGGPANRSIPVSQSHCQTRSLSPLRKKNNIFYTSNFIMNQKRVLERLQQMNAQTQASTINKGSNNNTLGHLTVEDFAQSGYYSQSPQPKLRNSPYLSDDEYKILHDYYDIQCEPTSMHRGGVPLMKVKRVQRPKNRTFNIFNFPDDPTTNAQLPKALTSLQIFYPHFQPSQADYMARYMASPSKWFDRFNQSTRNLNQTINNLHNQHTRKLRSYSISNLNSQAANTSVNINGGSNALKMRCGSQNSLFQKKNQAKERSAALIERSRINRGDNSQSPEILMNNLTNDFSRTGGIIMNSKSKSKKRINTISGQESGTNSSTIVMPPLHKIYTASLGHGGQRNMHNSLNNYESSHEKIRMSKKSAGQNGKTLPPRPGNNKKGGIFGSKTIGNIQGGETSNNMTAATISESTEAYQQKNLVPPSGPSHNIGNTPKNNQYVCFGVNIITKSDK